MPKPSLAEAQRIAERKGISLGEALEQEVPAEHRFTIRVSREAEEGFDYYVGAIAGTEYETGCWTGAHDAATVAINKALEPILSSDSWTGTIEVTFRLHPSKQEEEGEKQP